MTDQAKLLYQLKDAFGKGLPGTDVQWAMASSSILRKEFPRTPGPDSREAAVLILLWPEDGLIRTVFMQRPEYEGWHGGQISFPGGKREPDDVNLIRTALREASEETGIDTKSLEIIGTLTPLFIPVSNMVVTAVVAVTEKKPVFMPDPAEVLYLIEADLKTLLDPEIIKLTPMEIRGGIYEVKYFSYGGKVIWGATAMMLNELLEIFRRNNISPAF
jgi:8-oxo-dGTP pyrophosphatase MutT (NUDIX family)